DIIIANDPDADRVGAMAAHNGEFVGLTGNELGVLMTHYLLNRHKEQGDMPENPAIVSTIVSTNLTRAIAEDFGAAYFEVLTGFKYIGEKMTNWEQTKEHSYVFGFEESIGFLPGDYARDKDAVAASLLICEMAAHYKAQGLTLIDAMNKLLEKYGYHYDYNISITKTGMEGAAQIRHIMEDLRKNPPADIGGISVAAVRDYRPGYGGLPPSDVLYYELADNSWFCIRPSGTEPKIKIYCGVIGENPTHAAQKARDLADLIVSVIN
ncbi:MAG: phospho-sugar mutase, partial [Defluviitaleaceae bacterium]|nr:phospho-sugar mutase [Defluviitaleaceae bacterium]